MERLDVYLVNKGMVSTRSKAQQLIKIGNIQCNGQRINKCGYKVKTTDIITVDSFDVLKYVSRGGLKLEKAIREFALDFKDKKILDIGSSTGGFTDCALQHGARNVVAVDVGKDIMDKSLSLDPRIILYEETDIRDISSELLKDIDLFVCDVSFISLEAVIPFLCRDGHIIPGVFLIKPQFECGKKIAGKSKGVIKSRSTHKNVLRTVIPFIQSCGYQLKGITYSPIEGGNGNIEYITWFVGGTPIEIDLDRIVDEAFAYFER